MSNPIKTPKKTSESTQNIQVYVRCRPLNAEEKAVASFTSVSCPSSKEVSVKEKFSTHMPNATKTYSFDKVFAPTSSQVEVYRSVVSPLIKEVLRGYNCTVFAYGQTGTGKTHTMEGLNDYNGTWETDPTAGIIPRSLVDIFDASTKKGVDPDSFQIKVSFLELYNEEIYDLLSKGMDLETKKHKIFEDSAKKGSVIVQGLEERVVKSKESVLKILEEGSMKRQTAATKMNASSSRSHTIFTITVTQTEKSIVGQEKYIEGKLNLVDLAGSENIGRSGAVDKRAREAGKINESLLTLGRVINSLVKRENHIPYRESKLTRLLQDSLGGRTKTSIIATISPASINLEETVSTLDYAFRAKNITNRPEVNQKIPVASKLAEMQARLDQIRNELADQRERDGGVFMSQEKKDEMEKKMLELEQLRKEYIDLTTLFDLRNAEIEQLKMDLADTLEQLEEKTAVLVKTQEEKEVQEHLVAKHVETEAKITKQAFELREAADQQYDDLDKLQDVRERKSKIEKLNKMASNKYHESSKQRYDQLSSLISTRTETTDKMCQAFDHKQDEVVGHSQEMVQKSVEDWGKVDAKVKESLTEVDRLSANQMHSEQKFLSEILKKGLEKMEEESAKAQAHLTKHLDRTTEQESAVNQLAQTNDNAHSFFKEFISKTQSKHLENSKKRSDLVLASNGGQHDHIDKSDAIRREMKDEIQELHDLLQSYKTERDSAMEIVRNGQAMVDSITSKIDKASAKIEVLEQKLRDSTDEVQAAMKIADAAVKTLKQLEETERLEMEEHAAEATAEAVNQHQDQTRTTDQILDTIAATKEMEKDYIGQSQEVEKARYEELEVAFRARSDEAPKHHIKLTELTRDVQKLSSDSLRDYLGATESFSSDIHRWKEEGKKDSESFCQQINSLDSKIQDTVSEVKAKEIKFFKDDLKNDKPSGQTPVRRTERSYPRSIVQGTPDEERVRRYRHLQGLGAAAKLEINDDESLDGSTNVPESRPLSRNESSPSQGYVSNVSLESEEVGYASDGENIDPNFVHPGSKLRPRTRSRLPTRAGKK